MKITDVRTAFVEANYDWTFIRIYTDKVVTEIGESFPAPSFGVDLNETVARKDVRCGEPFFGE